MHPAEACSGLTLPYTGQHREHDGKRQKWAMCDDKAQYEMSTHLQLLYHQSVLENATGGRWCPTVLYLVSQLRNSAMAVTMESNDSSEKDHGFGGRKKSDVFYCSVQIFRAARSQTGESQILVTAKAVPAMGTELIQGSIAAWKQSERSLCCQLLGETQSRWTIKVLQYRCLAVWRTTTKHFKIYQEFYVIIWKDLKRVKKNWAVGALFSENDTQAIIHSKMVIRTQQVGNLIRAGEPPQL